MSGQGSGEMKQGVEHLSDLSVVELSHEEFAERMGEISHLRYNALDAGKNRAPKPVRSRELKDIKLHMNRPGQHDSFFCALQGDRIVGFLAVERHPREKFGDIRDMWTEETGKKQRVVIEHLLRSAKQYLITHGIPTLKAVSKNPNFNTGNFTGFLRRTNEGASDEAVDALDEGPMLEEPAADMLEDVPESDIEVEE